MDKKRLKNDIEQGQKLLAAISQASRIIGDLSLNSLAGAEVMRLHKRAEAIRWSLLVYCNDVTAMLKEWRGELRKRTKVVRNKIVQKL